MDPNAIASQISALDQGYNATDQYNKITTQLGIPDARTRVQALQSNLLNTENAIKSVDPSVTARTSGGLVTEAQRGRLVNMEKQPLTDTYNEQNQAYGTEQGNLNGLMTQADQQASLADSDYKNKRQSLADQLTFAQKQQSDAEAKREFDVSASQKASSGGSSNNPAAGYKVGRLSSGNYKFTGPNGDTNMYQYAAALSGGDPDATYNTIKQLLAGGSATDKGAAAGIAKLEKQGLSQDQIIGRLKASNGYIFN